MQEETVSRKDFFKKGILKAFGFLQENFGDSLGIISYSPIRPPGAIDEKDFLDTCVKCGNCVDVCPQNSIKFSGLEAGFVAGFPVVKVNEKPCFVCDDLSCMKNCPTGALVLVPKEEIKMGYAEVIQDKCITYQDKECNICVTSCPFPEVAISIDENKHPLVTDKCTGCGLCDYWCEFNAIKIQSYR